MKTRFSLLCIALTLLLYSVVHAQDGNHFGGAIAEPGFQQVSGLLHQQQTGSRAGRVWFEANLADQGLGYTGAYLTLGGKRRLFEDRLDGRWLFEGQVHHSLEENGGPFANFGIERVFSLASAGADVSVGVWYDYDGDTQADFSHEFHQVGVSASIKTLSWDLMGNGYFPVGIQDYVIGDPAGVNCFFGHNIVTIPGIDAALEGFDVTLRLRPKQLAFANGYVDFGGYHYSSELINAFGGGRVRMGFQALRGLLVNVEINHDERFDTTAVVGLGWTFGANNNGYGQEYSGVGRDLERTVRNDHIVRSNQSAVLALDPDTGAPYNVVHVDNTADPSFETGSAETPYTSLQTAQNLSAPGDIILVNAGDGTDRNQNTGIRLQDNQRLWGAGESVLLPIQNGLNFQVCTDPNGGVPTISNAGGFAVVTLADNNDVAGINIDATGAQFGIFGNGNQASIRNNTISGATLDGVLYSGSGDVTISGNNIVDNGRNGVFLFNQLDQTANISIQDNNITGNILDGIRMFNYGPAMLDISNNVTSNNLRHGLSLENHSNSNSMGVTIMNHTSDSNSGSGVFVNRGSGNLSFINSTFTNNIASGLLIRNWTTVDPERVFVGTTEGGVSTISNNGAFANFGIVLDEPGASSRFLVSNQSLDDGVRGIAARAEGFDSVSNARTTLDIDIIDNLSISRNLNDGIALTALDGGLIRANIRNSEGETPLQIVGNASGGGDGISILADGINGQPQAEVQANIENVFINNAVNSVTASDGTTTVIPTDGIGVDGINNSLVDLDVTNSTIGSTATGGTETGIRLNLANNGSRLINRVNVDNVNVFSNLGVSLFTGPQTLTDFTLANSSLQPTAGGSNGLSITVTGQAAASGNMNVAFSNGLPMFSDDLVSDGLIDNLTRVTLLNNSIDSYTNDGVNIQANGDAHLLLRMAGNDISNNGSGGSTTLLPYFDGVNIDAFNDSVISAEISGNTFRGNFERGLSLNTFHSATINAVLTNNTFFGNDIGEATVTGPPAGVGTESGPVGEVVTSGSFSFEAINNEEFFFRNFEIAVFLDGMGVPTQPDGTPLPADSPGVPLGVNDGDIFGTPIALGTAELNLSMSNNSLQLGAELLDFAVAPGDFTIGLDGVTNGIGPIIPGLTNVGPALGEILLTNEELFFQAQGL